MFLKKSKIIVQILSINKRTKEYRKYSTESIEKIFNILNKHLNSYTEYINEMLQWSLYLHTNGGVMVIL